MAKKARAGKSDKAQYTAYKSGNKWQKNKIRKLEKRIAANPNDIGAVEALKIAHTKVYGRGKPGQKGWFHPQEHKLIKLLDSKDVDVQKLTKDKLIKLRDVQNSTRPTAIKVSEPLVAQETIPDKLYTIGLINEKRKRNANKGMGRIRRR